MKCSGVHLSPHSPAAAAGLLLSAVLAGDIDRLWRGAQQQQWRGSMAHSSKLRLAANANCVAFTTDVGS